MRVTTRLWAACCAVAVVIVAAGGYVLGVQPQIAHAEETDAAAQAVQAQVGTTQARISALTKVAAKQDRLEAEAAVLRKSVPSTLQSGAFLSRVSQVAALDAVRVKTITVGVPSAYQPQPAAVAAAAATAAAAAAATAAVSAAATPAPTATATVAAPAIAAPVLAATDPAITSSNFTVIPMTVVVQGTAAAGMQFLKDLQNDERLYLVSGFTTISDTDSTGGSGSVTTTLVGSVYAIKG